MNIITIVGMGPGGEDYLNIKAFKELTSGKNVFLRTEKHPVVNYLVENGMKYKSFDYIYDSSESFDVTYELIAAEIVSIANKTPVVYAVPGNPFVAEKTVSLICEKYPKHLIEIVHGTSFIDAMITALKYDPVSGVEIVDGLKIQNEILNPKRDRIIIQVYDQLTASQVKLSLMDRYEDFHKVYIVRAAGIPKQEEIKRVSLCELDYSENIFDHLTSIFVPSTKEKIYTFEDLQGIMKQLRSESGCPWDREQTHESIAKHLVEEAYEVIDAINNQDDESLVDELGDVLLQVVFHATMANEDGYFSINDIINGICEKMIRRHPHVFSDVSVSDSDEVLVNWQAIKDKEKNNDKIYEAMNSISKSSPALIRSQKVQKIASNVGFDWKNVIDALDKIDEELQEFKIEIMTNKLETIEEELGDLLMIIANVSRLLKIDAELALSKAIDKFIRRFRYIEEQMAAENQVPSADLFDKMDNLWLEAKKWEKSQKK